MSLRNVTNKPSRSSSVQSNRSNRSNSNSRKGSLRTKRDSEGSLRNKRDSVHEMPRTMSASGKGEVLFFDSTTKKRGLNMSKKRASISADDKKKAIQQANTVKALQQSFEKADATPIDSPPRKIWLTVYDTAAGGEHLSNPVRMMSGLYLLVDGRIVNNKPVWEQAGGDAQIESNKKGHWAVTRDTGDVLVSMAGSSDKHPHEAEIYRSKYYKAQREREKEAALECGNGVWSGQDSSGDGFITNTKPELHGYRFGRAVVASRDIKEEGALRIPLGCLGIVMGPSPHPLALRVKFDSFDAPFNVNHTELDLAEGPPVLVTLSNGDTCVGSVVNVSDDRVKVHFNGRLKTEDEWFDKDTHKIQPLFSDNPEGLMYCTESDVSSDESVGNIPIGRRGTFL
eukprot:TRINITY_DN2073_c0_g1_i1.p1 TRINITY_DN2073_c0_g1~~TRINITY_DN2073_c0_g1_i1.p1  ORF type:complete len:397 (+),score=57.93 TRINITY_DN2073_c0_g1_i1:49-1239(+)